MDFNKLDDNTKKQIHEELTQKAASVGGTNFFLKMLEDIRKEKPNALLNKSSVFHYSEGKISWDKAIYKDTLTLLFSAMRKEEKDGDMLNGLNPKDYKSTMNMMRALKPTGIMIKPKNVENGEGFTLPILDSSSQKNTKVSFLFKVIFFYSVEDSKKILNYEVK